MCRKLTCLASLVLLLGAVNSVLALGPATNPSPANGATIADTWVTLSWQPGIDAVLHHVYFGDNFVDVYNGAEGTFQGSQDSTTFTVGFPGFAYPDGLIPGRTYYWRVDEDDDLPVIMIQSLLKGVVWSFTVEPPPPPQPDPPINPSPRNGATNQSINVVMRWENGGRATSYRVYFGTDPTPDSSEYKRSQTGTSYDPGTLNYTTTYYWRIDATNSSGTTTGDVWRFTTGVPEPPQPSKPLKPINPSPINRATNQSINVIMSWEDGGGAATYDVYLGTDPTPDSSEYKRSQIGTSYDPGTLNYSTTYYWRIDAWNSSGTTTGDVWRFTTERPQAIDGGVKAEYFAGMIPQGIPCLTQIEPRIDWNWGRNEVACGRSDDVSARWTADLVIPVSDTYTFYTTSDDGVRLYLNRERIIDNWTGYGVRDNESPPLELVEGRVYPLVMEWYDSREDAVAQLYWETPNMTRQIIPPGPLQPPQPTPVDDGAGTVFEAGGFEHFTDDVDEGTAIFQTWIGGEHPDDPADVDNRTGMRVGHLNPPYAEQTIVYSGEQSMPLYYDNSEPPFYSQADRTWDISQDWTANGIIGLNLQVHGRPGNDAAPLYIEVKDIYGRAGVVFHPDPDVLLIDKWTGWWIPLSDFANAGVDLTSVKTMSIGMGEPDRDRDGLLNDDCADAIHIGNVTNLPFDTTNATFDGPGHCTTAPNIWYIYTATQSGGLTVSLCGSSYDTMLAVYDGSDCPPKLEDMLRCNDDSDSCRRQSEVEFYVTVGRAYLIEIGGFGSITGQGVMNISYGMVPDGRPSNDDCDDAMSVGNVTNLRFDTTYATFDGPGYCMESPNIWYTYYADHTGSVTVSLCGSSYDSKLAVYNRVNCPPSQSDLIGCNDDFCGTNAQITFTAFAGSHYLIEVGAYNGEAGQGVLNISSEGDLANPLLRGGPKLFANSDSEEEEDVAYVDQIITVGTGPAWLTGTVYYLSGEVQIPIGDAKVTLFPHGWMGAFWGKTLNNGQYLIDPIQGVYDVTVTKDGSTIHTSSKPLVLNRSDLRTEDLESEKP